mgnify:CR=1 FL=1
MKVEINVPENLNDITLGQYQEFLRLEDPKEDDVLGIFLGLDLNGIGKIKASDVEKYSKHINDLFEQEQQHTLRFNLNGLEFGFIPNLDEITYGENKDVTAYLNDWQKMHKAMAVLYRPIINKFGKKYLVEEYEGSHKYSELMKLMPLGIVMGSLVFFCNLTNELLKAIPSFLEKEMKEEQMSKVILQENGEAIRNYIRSLKETLDDLTKLQTYPYILA